MADVFINQVYFPLIPVQFCCSQYHVAYTVLVKYSLLCTRPLCQEVTVSMYQMAAVFGHAANELVLFCPQGWDTNVLKTPLKQGTMTIRDASFDFVLTTKKKRKMTKLPGGGGDPKKTEGQESTELEQHHSYVWLLRWVPLHILLLLLLL